MKAYPFQHKNPTSGLVSESQGMDLRDYFAAKAMQAILSNPDYMQEDRKLAEASYAVADAMMKAREE